MLTSHQPRERRPLSDVGSFANDASVTAIGRRSVPKKTRTVVVFVEGSGGSAAVGACFMPPPAEFIDGDGGFAFCPGDGFGGGGVDGVVGGGGASTGGGVTGAVSGGSAPAAGGPDWTFAAGGAPHPPAHIHTAASTQSVTPLLARSRTMSVRISGRPA